MSTLTPAQQARQSARTATGEYSEMARVEPEISDLTQSYTWGDRRDALMAAGYVPAVAHATHLDPRDRSHRERWCDEHFTSGEYNHLDGDVPKMPDDDTPSHTGGQAISGNRRTHRVRYTGAGMTLRMPSVTAVRRFRSTSGKPTFDVPVSVLRPDGTAVSGWVRVSGDDHDWLVKPQGFRGLNDAAAIGEAVNAVLESRRPTRALAAIGSPEKLLAKHEERLRSRGSEVLRVNSSWIEGFGFEEHDSTMVMQTQSGRSYGYKVTPGMFSKVMNADSPGAVFNKLIKRNAPRVNVSTCPKCARIYATPTHTCPAHATTRIVGDQFIEAAKARAQRLLSMRHR